MDTIKIKKRIDSTHLEIDELNDWIGKEVDIIIIEKSSKPDSSKKSAAGILSDYSDKDRIVTEKFGWVKAAKEKHGNS